MKRKPSAYEPVGFVGNAARVRRRVAPESPPEPRVPAAIIIMQTHAYLLGQVLPVFAALHPPEIAAALAVSYLEAAINEGVARGYILPKEAAKQ